MSGQGDMKINVVSNKDGAVTVLTGKNFVSLTDTSFSTFKTSDIGSFVRFARQLTDNQPIIYDESGAIIPRLPVRGYRDQVKLEITETDYVSLLRSLVQSQFNLKQLDILISKLRVFADTNAKQLLESLRNMVISKVTNITQSRSKSGNYTYSVQREGSGKDEFTPPEYINFTIPVIRFLDEDVDMQNFSFEPYFSFDESEGNVEMRFTFINYDFASILLAKKKEILERYLAPVADIHPMYYGKVDVTEQDDSWKYRAIA